VHRFPVKYSFVPFPYPGADPHVTRGGKMDRRSRPAGPANGRTAATLKATCDFDPAQPRAQQMAARQPAGTPITLPATRAR
jgi:hypothetical protein